MAKFRVIGADRETGEDVELVIEADTSDAARAKGNRRGVMVSECLAADVPPTATTTPSQPVGQAKRRRSLLKSFVILVALIAVTFTIIYYTVLKPQSDAISATADAAVAQIDKTAEMKQVADARENQKAHLKLLAEQDRDAFLIRITDNFKLGKVAAVERDPIVGPLITEHPEVVPLICKDEISSPELFAAMRKLELDYGTQAYVRAFANALFALEKP